MPTATVTKPAAEAPAATTESTAKVTKLPLTGQDLLDFVNKQGNSTKSRTALAREAGYFTMVDGPKGPKERVAVQAFYDAYIGAQTGISLKGRSSASRASNGEASIHANGILLIGKSYTSKFGFRPGDTFTIEQTPEGVSLKLKSRGPEPEKAETKTPEPTTKPIDL